jgi:pimeloyl-ACP methyl ester carboxylesterase
MPRIDLDGARVAYADAGSGETVLLLHGKASSGAQWRCLTEALRPACRILAPDLYGIHFSSFQRGPHKRSPRQQDSFSRTQAWHPEAIHSR